MNLKHNAEGYNDPTCYGGIKDTVKKERDLDKLNSKLIHTIRFIVELSGFEICNRIVLKDKKTGKVFK